MFVLSYIVKKYYQYRKKQHLPTIKRIPSDNVWNEVQHILPKEKPHNTKGYPAAVPFRKVLDGILFVLRTGCQWNMLPKEYGSGSTTCHIRFQHWVRMGIFQKLWISLLKIYDYLQDIKLKWQSLDSVSIKAPQGDKIGLNPTVRGKLGTKRHILTDKKGVPLSVVITSANIHDVNAAIETMDDIVFRRPAKNKKKQNLCLDRGYDSHEIECEVMKRRYIPHIRRKG